MGFSLIGLCFTVGPWPITWWMYLCTDSFLLTPILEIAVFRPVVLVLAPGLVVPRYPDYDWGFVS
ncbi:hypothetical protein BDV32DRAFT_128700 [Aspergillus pseudonomiae]|nr:hypothetical protein BDV32DRAFT_128700 [Aspergillus pseudonomiae]